MMDGLPERRPAAGVADCCILLLLAAITVALGAWGAAQWSLIPIGLGQRVTSTSWSDNGPPFKELHLTDGRTLEVDTALYGRLGGKDIVGHHLAKRPWSSSLGTDERVLGLHVSAQFWKVVTVLVVLGIVATFRMLLLPARADRDRPALGVTADHGC